MCVSTTSPTPTRRLSTDTSYPVMFLETAILIPFPNERDKGEVLYLAFTTNVRMINFILFKWLI